MLRRRRPGGGWTMDVFWGRPRIECHALAVQSHLLDHVKRHHRSHPGNGEPPPVSVCFSTTLSAASYFCMRYENSCSFPGVLLLLYASVARYFLFMICSALTAQLPPECVSGIPTTILASLHASILVRRSTDPPWRLKAIKPIKWGWVFIDVMRLLEGHESIFTQGVVQFRGHRVFQREVHFLYSTPSWHVVIVVSGVSLDGLGVPLEEVCAMLDPFLPRWTDGGRSGNGIWRLA